MGQMLRGGRSCPSERKLAAGAAGAANNSVAASWGAKTVANVVVMATPAQQDAQRLHLSWCPAPPWS